MSLLTRTMTGPYFDGRLAVQVARGDLLADFLRLGRDARPGAVERQAAGASRAGVLSGRRRHIGRRRAADSAGSSVSPVGMLKPARRLGGEGEGKNWREGDV